MYIHSCVNPFAPNASFPYPLKTSENRKVFWYFQGVEKGFTGNEWVKRENEINKCKEIIETFNKEPVKFLRALTKIKI